MSKQVSTRAAISGVARLVAVAALGAAGGAAQANVMSSAELGATQIQAFDAAGNSFAGGFVFTPGRTIDEVYITDPLHPHGNNDSAFLPGWYAAGSAAAPSGVTQGAASSNSDHLYASGGYAGAMPPDGLYNYSSHAWSFARPDDVVQPGMLSIAPHATVKISASYDLAASVDAIGCHSATGCQRASSWVTLYSDSSAFGFQMVEESVGLGDLGESGPTGPQSRQGLLTLTLTNNTDQWQEASLNASASAAGNIIPGVPEPGSWALMLVGLIGVAPLARRRALKR